MKISVVINTYNRASHLNNALSALKFQRFNEFEVIVVNGPSTDDTDAVLAQFRQKIKLVECSEPNLSKSRNLGIQHACGDIVAFLDDDAIPEPNWLKNLSSYYRDPNIGGVGGFIRNHTGVEFQCQYVLCDRFGESKNFKLENDFSLIQRPGADHYFSLTGCNSSFRRDALLKIGGFDEEYAYFLDETDVCVRLVDQGYKLKFAPNAQVLHKYAESHLRNHENIPSSLYLTAKSKAYFCMKFLGQTNLSEVLSLLLKYKKSLLQDCLRLLKNNKINREHYEKLSGEIEDGIKSGIANAAKNPDGKNGLKQSINGTVDKFKSYNPLSGQCQKMRIVFCSRDYGTANSGGIGVWTEEVAKGLAKRGHEITIITAANGHDHPTVDFVDGIWVHRILSLWQPDRTHPPLPNMPQVIRDYCYTLFDEVMRVKRLRGIDIVSFPIWDLEGAACFTSQNIKTVMSLHTSYALALPHKPTWQKKKYYKEHVKPMISSESHFLTSKIRLIANSDVVIKDMEVAYKIKIDPDRVTKIHHGVEDLSKKVSNRTRRAPTKTLKKPITILFVGRFEKRKGIDLLLGVIPETLERYDNVIFRLVGDNQLTDDNINYMQDFVKKFSRSTWFDRVQFQGKISQAELLVEYKNCDIFVAPSRYESFGLIFVEASIFGKPIIAANIGGAKEVISNEVSGLLFDLERPNSLIKCIERLINDDSLRLQLGNQARKNYEQKYTSKSMVDSLEQLYRVECAPTFVKNATP